MARKDNKLVVAIVLLLVLLAAGSAHAGLVAHWKLDEIGGTTVSDSTGKGVGTVLEDYEIVGECYLALLLKDYLLKNANLDIDAELENIRLNIFQSQL
ncbi:MAG: hypothetical protein ACYTBJ_08995 [Planctomycetota bacterium]|jgi:hypothetical protein